ncbi:MAG: hypothetical protein H6Q73_3492 [Firmicutes bacterium]|nr:hypothetical protein [Bacillota bacterium]
MANLSQSTSQSSFKTIIDTLLADINAVVPNFSSLVSSYRLLVGSAEEINRTPGVSPDVVARSIERFDRTGVLIDIIIDLLCCKVAFVSDLLSVTGGPVDLIRLLTNRVDVAESPHQVAEEVLLLEVLRRAESCLRGNGSSGPPPCTPPGPPPYTFATSSYQPPTNPNDYFPEEPLPECFQPIDQKPTRHIDRAADSSLSKTLTEPSAGLNPKKAPPPNARPRKLRKD